MKSEPEWNQLPGKTPTAIRTLVRRCLEKHLRRRLGHISEARILIEDVISGTVANQEETAGVGTKAFKRLAVPGLAALSVGLAVAVAVLALVHFRETVPARPVTRTVINLPPGDQFENLDLPVLAISPDGKQLAYIATRNNVRQIYLRPLDGFETRPIAGTEGANIPFFSPDGQWIGFYANGALKKILTSGGAALTLANLGTANYRGASWGSQGSVIFAALTVGPLQQVSEAGGVPQPLTHLEAGENTHRWPEFLPGGKALIFALGSNGSISSSRIEGYILGSKKQKTIVPSGTHPRYAPSGHLIYVQAGTLLAVPFDVQRLQATGTPVPVIEGVVQSPGSWDAQYAISNDGSLAYIPGGFQATQRKMVWVDRKGTEQAITAPPHAYRYPRISPEGQRVAVTVEEGEGNLWVYDFRRDTLTRLTFQGAVNLMGAWTPDGKRIAFGSSVNGSAQNIFWQEADGGGASERLETGEYTTTPNSFSPDGQSLAFTKTTTNGARDIWILHLSDHKTQPFLQTPADDGGPVFSPDGKWLLYMSEESGRAEIYVQPYPGPGGKWQISTDGGTEAAWNHNGREIFYRNRNKMMAVDVTLQPSFSAGKPHMLFEGQYVPTPGTFANYDVSPDGQRFLMLKQAEQAQAATQINVVLNWTEELKRRVPAGTK